MPITKHAIVIDSLCRGRNQYDAPMNIPEGQCYEALNVDFWDSECGAKRQGSVAIAVTFSAGGPFSSTIGSLIRHVPADDEAAAELWAIDSGSTSRFGRLFGGTTWVQATLKDNLAASTDARNVIGATLNGLLFLAYNATGSGNRLYVWDGSTVRRVGLATPAAAPTGATDGGAGLTFSRVYRVRWVHVSGSDIVRMSEASATLSMSITDDAGYTVTRPTAASEGETHWDLEAAATTAGPFYRIARTVIATTTFDDTSATIATTNPSPVDGINFPPPSAKYIVATDARIVMAGAYHTSGGYTTPKNNRVWFTPVIADNDIGDLERIPTGRYLDVDAPITGLAVAADGEILVFSYRRCWRLVPTGDPTEPYARFTVSTAIGCVRHQSIVNAEDQYGNPAVYWMSQRGVYRYGRNGLEYCSLDCVDLLTPASILFAHGAYYADKYQIWWWVGNQGFGTTSSYKLVFDVREGSPERNGIIRGGWVHHTGDSAATYASVMFSTTLAASMSKGLKPYIAQSGATGAIWMCDDTGTYADNTTAYQSYVKTPEYVPYGLATNFSVNYPHLVYATAGNVLTFDLKYGGDLFMSTGGATAISDVVPLDASPIVGMAVHRKASLQGSGMGSVAFQFGNITGGATDAHFNVDALHVPIAEQEPR